MTALVLISMMIACCAGQDLPQPGVPVPWLKQDAKAGRGASGGFESPVSTAALRLDLARLRGIRNALEGTLRDAGARKALFEPDALRFEENRLEAERLWARGLDALIAADSVLRRWRPLCGREPALLCLAALSLQVRWASEWAARGGAEGALLLDARKPEEGLPGRAFSRLREGLLGPGPRAALADARLAPAAKAAGRLLGRREAFELEAWIREDLRRLGVSPRRGRVSPLAARLPAGEARILPWTEGWVREDAAVYDLAPSSWCFTPEPLFQLQRDMRPGDVVLLHRGPAEGAVGAPGFWNRAAVHGEAGPAPGPCPATLAEDRGGAPRAFLSLEEAAAGRAVAVLRPRGPLPGGRPSPNALARRFDEEFGYKTRLLDFVGGLERAASGEHAAVPVEDFRRSWRRPKWDFIQQEPSGGTK